MDKKEKLAIKVLKATQDAAAQAALLLHAIENGFDDALAYHVDYLKATNRMNKALIALDQELRPGEIQ